MASGFVAAGGGSESQPEDTAWQEARQAVEAARAQTDGDIQHGKPGESLYHVLQANKAAKQEAFEESIRLKNQFRTLDEDEVEFLDSVLASTREKEEAVKRETRAQVEQFRQRQGAEHGIVEGESDSKQPRDDSGSPTSPTTDQPNWSQVSRKKRKGSGNQPSKSLKMRKLSAEKTPTVEKGTTVGKTPTVRQTPAAEMASTTREAPSSRDKYQGTTSHRGLGTEEISSRGQARPAAPHNEVLGPSLGLSGYGSDDDSDGA